MVAIGGDGNSGLGSNVEVINVEKNVSCNAAPYPYALGFHSATLIPPGILVCGGLVSPRSNGNKCYRYNKATTSWQSFPSMTFGRYWFDMKFLNEGVWAIGGYGGHPNARSYDALDTMDSFDFNTNVWTRHDIGMYVYLHCLSKISNHKLIIIGGFQHHMVS